MSEFSDPQKTRLHVTFVRVDELLAEAVDLLDPAATRSSFFQYLCDAAPGQHTALAKQAWQVREAMRRILDGHGIPPRPTQLSAVRVARTLVQSANVCVEELESRHLRGYGELTAQATADVWNIVTELSALLNSMEQLLAPKPEHNISE